MRKEKKIDKLYYFIICVHYSCSANRYAKAVATEQFKMESKSLITADFTAWLSSVFPTLYKSKNEFLYKNTLFCYCSKSDEKQVLYLLLKLDMELLSRQRDNEITGTAQTQLYVVTGSFALPLALLSVIELADEKSSVCVCVWYRQKWMLFLVQFWV